MSILRKFLRRAAISYGLLGASYLSFPYWPESQFKYDALAVTRNRTQMFFAFWVLFQSVRDYKKNVEPLYGTEEYRKTVREYHIRVAERIYDLCVRSKGLYIKFGQYLSTMDRVIPKEVTDILKKLQDSCPPHEFKTMEIVLDKALPEWREHILQIEEKPIGSASLAQVHKARLVDGTEVAVKIQYPELQLQFDMDLRTLTSLASFAKKFMTRFGMTSLNVDEILSKFKSSVRNEMDFLLELRNAESTSKLLGNSTDVVIPEFHKDLCSPRVLTMDYINGVRIDETEHIRNVLKLDTRRVGDILVDLYLKMIFDTGKIHCDPHPGNILVRPNPFAPDQPQIVLLDHGFYRHLTPEVQQKFIELWVALINSDNTRIRAISKWFGIEKKADYLSLIFLFKSKNTRRLGEDFAQSEIDRLRQKEILSLANVSEMLDEFPEDFLMIIRTMNMVSMRNAALGNTQRSRLLKTTRKVFQKYYGKMVWRIFWAILRFKLWVFENTFHLLRWVRRTDSELLL